MPLGRIRLDITFGQPDNFCKEPLTFEVVNLHNVYHTILDCPCFAKFIAIPNYTYQKLKVPGPMGVITTNDSFEVAHYYEQDRVTQAATLVIPCNPVSFGRDAGKDVAEESTKAAALLARPSTGEADKTPGGSDGSAGPSIQVLNPPEGVDPLEVSSDLSP
jgi:hypothetical protein